MPTTKILNSKINMAVKILCFGYNNKCYNTHVKQ